MASATTLIGILLDFFEDQGIELPAEQISPFHLHDLRSLKEIEEAALRIRQEWNLGLGPIGNVATLLENKGIMLFYLFEDCHEIDAFSAWHRRHPLICLNTEKDSSSRTRFNGAHELGHLVMHTECLPGDRHHEDEANYFASSFLMPRESFAAECPRRLVWDHFLALKIRWGVSLSAMVRRARDLSILSEDTYRRANVNLGKLGWRRGEPSEPAHEIPSLLRQCVALLENNGVSLDAIAEGVGISKPDLMWLTNVEKNI